jgi:hypothetical protein
VCLPFEAVGGVPVSVLSLVLAIGRCGVVLVIAFVKQAEEETARLGIVFLLFFGPMLATEGRDAVEEELGDVGEGLGVAAGDAFVSELLDEIAEEGVDGTRGCEISDVVEEFVGGGFVLDAACLQLLADVVGTEGGAGISGEHVTTMAFAVDVLAGGESRRFRDDYGGEGGPTPGGFCGSDLIPWELPRRVAQ